MFRPLAALRRGECNRGENEYTQGIGVSDYVCDVMSSFNVYNITVRDRWGGEI